MHIVLIGQDVSVDMECTRRQSIAVRTTTFSKARQRFVGLRREFDSVAAMVAKTYADQATELPDRVSFVHTLLRANACCFTACVLDFSNDCVQTVQNPMLMEVLASARELFDRTSRRIALPSTESTLSLVSDCAHTLKILRQVCLSLFFWCHTDTRSPTWRSLRLKQHIEF